MMPSLMSTSSSSSSSAVVRVEKATSEFLNGPDWTLNIEICDIVNTNHWVAKDVVKAVKKRLQHKNPKVQLLALTLLETMVKNCGDNVHFQIVERNIPQEMVKIVKKTIDMHVRDEILILLDSWQVAFGGPGGKHPQYYWAYEELRRSGVEFPQRSVDAAPIFTPPITHPTPRIPQPGYGMPSNSSTRLDEAMAAEMENLSLSSINSMRNVLDLLADMLQAINPGDRMALRDEVIIDLVDQCRANQNMLMQMLTTSGDEELLCQGLELNDDLQSVLARHDATASGSPLNVKPQSTEINESNIKSTDVKVPGVAPNTDPTAPVLHATGGQIDQEEDEEEDEFAQLARRHTKFHSTASQSTLVQAGEGVPSIGSRESMAPSTPAMNMALVPSGPSVPAETTKDQDIIDLLSITLSISSSSTEAPHTPVSAMQNIHQGPVSHSMQSNTPSPEAYFENQGQALNSYVAPWAQPQPQAQMQARPQLQSHLQPQLRPPIEFMQSQPEPQQKSEPKSQPFPQHLQQKPQPLSLSNNQVQDQLQVQTPPQPQFSQYSGYPPPPWAATPGYFNNPNPSSRSPHMYRTQTMINTSTPLQGPRQLQHVASFPVRGSNESVMNGNATVSSSHGTTTATAVQKPFIPSYRLFEDLNVLGNKDGRFNATANASPGFSGTNGQSMIGRK